MHLIPCLGCLCFILFPLSLIFYLCFTDQLWSRSMVLKQQVDTLPAFVKHLLLLLPSPLFLGSFISPSLAPQLTHLPSSSHTLTGCLVFPSPPSLSLSLSLSFFLSPPSRWAIYAALHPLGFMENGITPCILCFFICFLPLLISWKIHTGLRKLYIIFVSVSTDFSLHLQSSWKRASAGINVHLNVLRLR